MSGKGKESPRTIDQEAIFTEALRQAVDLLQKNWFQDNVGIVAATLFEDGQTTSATSRYLPDQNRWLHAEAAALARFETLNGRSPKQTSTILVTLSPCLLESSSRFGASCSHRLLDSGITQVRYGCLDSGQATGISTYQQMGFDAAPTDDLELQKICHSLYALFNDLYSHGGRFSHLLNLPNPWPKIKQLIGLEPFEQ